MQHWPARAFRPPGNAIPNPTAYPPSVPVESFLSLFLDALAIPNSWEERQARLQHTPVQKARRSLAFARGSHAGSHAVLGRISHYYISPFLGTFSTRSVCCRGSVRAAFVMATWDCWQTHSLLLVRCSYGAIPRSSAKTCRRGKRDKTELLGCLPATTLQITYKLCRTPYSVIIFHFPHLPPATFFHPGTPAHPNHLRGIFPFQHTTTHTLVAALQEGEKARPVGGNTSIHAQLGWSQERAHDPTQENRPTPGKAQPGRPALLPH